VFKRVILIVLDSVGVGAAPDADKFGDQGSNTLGNISKWTKENNVDFSLPNLSRWGLAKIINSFGVDEVSKAQASTAKLKELSPGKDTSTGHWEMAGNVLTEEFPYFPKGFSQDFLNTWCQENKLKGWLGNKAASGTTILEELGEEHLESKKPIVYTSADSVFQVAASEEDFGLERLYEICRSARKLLNPLGVGRIIARPFVKEADGRFKRTENRRDFSLEPPSPNMLDLIFKNKLFVAGIGKIEDIFAHRSFSYVDHTGNNQSTLNATIKMMEKTKNESGLIFSNLIDFDMLHGHRRNPGSYAQALMDFDKRLPEIESACQEGDLLVLTADHGNDPTHHGSDHTREYVPLLYWSPNPKFRAKDLQTLDGFNHIAALCLKSLGLEHEIDKISEIKNPVEY